MMTAPTNTVGLSVRDRLTLRRAIGDTPAVTIAQRPAGEAALYDAAGTGDVSTIQIPLSARTVD